MVFEYLESEPVASGSVAQVHRGRLRDEFVRDCVANGSLDHDVGFREVAVKVLHPGVAESAWIDGDIIFGAVVLLGKATGLDLVMPFDKDGFCRAMHRQLDLKWEAYNLKQFERNFSAEKSIQFPRVVAAEGAVLLESWCPGACISNLFSSNASHAFSKRAGGAGGAGVVDLDRRRWSQAEAGDGSGAVSASESSESGAHDLPTHELTEAKKKKMAADIFDMTIKVQRPSPAL